MQKYLLYLLCIFTCPVYAKSIDLNINDDAFRLTYAAGVDRNLVADMGFLYIDKKRRFDDEELALHAGLNLVSDNFRFGGRAFFVTPGDTEALALGFGFQARIPLSRVVGLGGHFYYAPSATSALDAEGYHEYSIRIDFKVARSGYLYVGYRNIKVKIFHPDNKVELDDDVMAGFKIYF